MMNLQDQLIADAQSLNSQPSQQAGLHKLAIVTDTFPPEINGVANTLRYLCEGLARQGCQVQVIRPLQQDENYLSPRQSTGAQSQLIVRGFPLPGYPGLRFGLSGTRRILQAWQSDRPDAVYVATEGPLGWMAVSVARRLGIPVSAGFHTNFQAYCHYYRAGFLAPIIAAYLRRFHNRVDRTLVPTHKMQSQLRAAGIRGVSVWGRGVDCQRFAPTYRDDTLRGQWGLLPNDLAVIYVGRLAAEKNLHMATHTFERIRRQQPRAKFILVGDGPLRKSLQQHHPDYRFAGSQTGESLARHYASADLFLFPSKTDTFGNVVLEAMASGLGVVAFDDAGASRLLVHQVNGMKIALDADENFVKAALKLASQPSFLNSLRLQAREDAQRMDWAQLIEHFQTLLTGDTAALTPLPVAAIPAKKLVRE